MTAFEWLVQGPDCNNNGVLDSCDIADGASQDVNQDGIPDECVLNDCNANGIEDESDIESEPHPTAI